MSKEKSVKLFTIREDVICVKCGNKGAVQHYGNYFPDGIGDIADNIESYEKYRNTPQMGHAIGLGGTIPHQCLNCGNAGLVDFGGLEGYPMAFQTIKE